MLKETTLFQIFSDSEFEEYRARREIKLQKVITNKIINNKYL